MASENNSHFTFGFVEEDSEVEGPKRKEDKSTFLPVEVRQEHQVNLKDYHRGVPE